MASIEEELDAQEADVANLEEAASDLARAVASLDEISAAMDEFLGRLGG